MVTKADINLNPAWVSATGICILLEIVYPKHIPQLPIVFVKVKVYFRGVQALPSEGTKRLSLLSPVCFRCIYSSIIPDTKQQG